MADGVPTRKTTDDPEGDERVRQSLAFTSAIAASLAEGLLAVDGAGRITFVNAAAETLLGWTAAELLGEDMHERVHALRADGTPFPASECPIVAAVRSHQVTRTDDDVFTTKDGALIPVAYTASPIQVDDRIEGTVVAFHNMTSVHEAAAARAQAVDRLSRLQVATAAMAVAVTPDEVAGVVIGQGIESLGARDGFLGLLDEEGVLEVAAAVGVPQPGGEGWRPLTAEEQVPLAEAVRTRQPVWLHSSICALPLVVGDRVLGSVGLSFTAGRELSADERSFLLTLADQAAQTLERARLFQGERQARDRQGFLARASRVLSTSLDYEATLAAVARLLVPEVADSCSIHLLDDTGLRMVTLVHVDEAKEELMRTLSAESGDRGVDPSLLAVAEGGGPLYVRSITPEMWDSIAKTPERRAQLEALDVRSGVMVALLAHDRVLGVLATTLTGSAQRLYTTADLELIQDVADRAAIAIDNARAHQARTEVARTLQQSLLPPRLPPTPGLEVAVRYHPVGDGSEVGGDFYDVFPMTDGRWGIVIGDVCGKGVAAASLTALARHTVRAAARGAKSPSAVLRALNQAIVEDVADERFCTVCHVVARPEPNGVTIAISCGGHPLPLLVEPNGTVRPIGCGGSAIGLFDGPDLADADHLLAPGHALVLFTDGLTEARSPEGAFAPDLLATTLAEAAGSTADELASAAERAILAFQGGRPRDDMALVVLRAPLPTDVEESETDASSGDASVFEARVPLEPGAVTTLRRDLAQWLSAHRPELESVGDDFLLVATELATNAARAARGHVGVRAWIDFHSLVLEVVDDGPGFESGPPPADTRPDPDAERGRGLYLVRSLVSDIAFSSGPTGTVVRVRTAF